MHRLLLTALIISTFAPQTIAADAPPNFVFIFCDDQGWTGLSKPMYPDRPETGSSFYRTPVIDQLASEGMTFSQAFAAHPKCECSRYSITFGMTTTSLNTPDKFVTTINTDIANAFANTLKRADPRYTTAMYGKWQLFRSPEEMGFDSSDGTTMNQDGDSPDPRDPKQMFGITQRGNDFMQGAVDAGRPFYLQLWHYAVHSAPQALPETVAKREKQPSGGRNSLDGAMSDDFDRVVGMTLQKIRDLGVLDNTYIIYMSDNGGPTDILRGGKADCTDGGLRVPLAIKGPGIQPGTYCDVPVVSYDLFPTLLDFAAPGFTVPDKVEGGSWKDILLNGGRGAVHRPIDRMVFFHASEGQGQVNQTHAAIRVGDYKLIQFWKDQRVELFNIPKDIGEQKDLAPTMSALASQLQRQLKDHVRKGLGEEAFVQLEAGTYQSRGGNRTGGGGGGRQRGGGRGGGQNLPDPIFTAIDADADGEISIDELQAVPNALRKLDTNADGQITADELNPGGRDGSGRSRNTNGGQQPN